MSFRARIVLLVALALVVIGVLAISIHAARAAGPSTEFVAGGFTGTSFSGPGCPSPIGLCTKSNTHGSLNGPTLLVVNSISPTPAPNVVLLDSGVTIHDQLGDITCREELTYNPTPGGVGEFAGLCELTGGTGHWAGATGYLQLAGTFPPGQPDSRGLYAGSITTH
jgi:hypothetical protein